MAYIKLREEYLEWMLLDKRQKEINSLPTTKKGWAEWKGVTTKTLRNWEKREDFAAKLEERREAQARQAANSTVAAVGTMRPRRHDGGAEARAAEPGEGLAEEVRPDDLDPGEWDYERVKNKIRDRALEGIKDAQDLWMKYWGKKYVEAELSDDTGLSELSVEEIVGEVIDLVGEETVSKVLVARRVGEPA